VAGGVAGPIAADATFLGQMPEPAHLGVPGRHRPGWKIGRHQGQIERALPAQGGGALHHAGVTGEAPRLFGPAAQVGRGGGGKPAVYVVQAATGPHRGQCGRQAPAGGMMVMDVVGSDDLGTGAGGEVDKGIVASRVERIAVVP
jgi:hypothetical protein